MQIKLSLQHKLKIDIPTPSSNIVQGVRQFFLITFLIGAISMTTQAQSTCLGMASTANKVGAQNCTGCLPNGYGYSSTNSGALYNQFYYVTTTHDEYNNPWATPIPASPIFGNTSFAVLDYDSSPGGGYGQNIKANVHGLEPGKTYTIVFNYMYKGGVCNSNAYVRHTTASGYDFLEIHQFNGGQQDVWYTQTYTWTTLANSSVYSSPFEIGDYFGGQSGLYGCHIVLDIGYIIEGTAADLDPDGDGLILTEDADPNDPCVPAQSIGYTGYDANNAVWQAADCDGDGVANSVDCAPYDASENGSINATGGTFSTHTGVAGTPANAGGTADDSFTGNLAGSDNLTLTYPTMSVGSEICVTVGFNDAAGTVRLSLNGTNYDFTNNVDGTGATSYEPQTFCITTTTAGPHTLVISETGSGNIRVDGSIITECVPMQDADGDGVPDANDNCPGTPANTVVDATGCPDTDGDAFVGLTDPDGSDPCNPDPNDPACLACPAGTTQPALIKN